ncbi:lytic transglycosylase domain-containing protein [Propionivibrio soli]|uniref:lytic transglycosylase domain-containing protein n=1 Tax=Propionivibrio soli TaxID=2976531 RepID=UPI0021E85873|nr:lytic transglycosylase domain-containing protein [Propionivibrio soli]
MSAFTTLKHVASGRSDVGSSLLQCAILIVALLFAFGVSSALPARSVPAETQVPAVAVQPSPAVSDSENASLVDVEKAPVLSPRMQAALDYVTRRYRVSSEALVPVFEMAQIIGKERRIDPLLIVAIIGIESRFNPFAESPMGAQGLMQVIPRYHQDKLPDDAGEKPLLDPLINIRVGVNVLEEAIRRRGGLVPGLQYYAGSLDPEGDYASKVLAERNRLEQAARRGMRDSA